MRLSRPAAALSAAALLVTVPLSGSVLAASHKKDAAPAAPAAKPAAPAAAVANPVVASVNGEPITLDRVRAAAQSLPDQMRGMPPQVLFPLIVNQLVDQKALLIEAQREDLQKDPAVQKAMMAAADQALQNIYLTRQVGPQVSDDAIKAVYANQYAGKPGEKEVHARHILVPDEKTAQDIIRQLKSGGDFVALSKKYSTDKAAASNGGDLGWFKQGDMLPDFSAAAFAMGKGQISDHPVHTRYGWHVIQVLDTRVSTPPAFDTVAAEIRQKVIQEAVRKAVDQAVAKVKVVRYNPNGTVVADKPTPAPGTTPPGTSPVPTQGTTTTPGTPPAGN